MNLLGAALPNLMFIAGILAIGIGLGIELKIVSLNKEINRGGRIGAFIVGAVLIAASILMYFNPSSPDRGLASSATGAATALPTQALPAPSATAAGNLAPTDEPALSAGQPTMAPMAEQSGVIVPDLHGMNEKDIKHKLEQSGLRVGDMRDQCEGVDQGGHDIKKGRILCQNPPAGQTVAPDTAVDYVLAK